MDNTLQVQIYKINADIKTLMNAVKKLVLEQRNNILDSNMKKLEKEKETRRYNTNFKINLKLLNRFNT